jgi:hypothetical protein
MAETPSPILFGVDQVVIACESDSSLSDSERKALCEQLVKKAQSVTELPVRLATETDTSALGGDRAKKSKQLLLRVSGKGRAIDHGRKDVDLSVTPVRLKGGAITPPLKSTVSFVKVQNDWLVQGPIDAFTKLLRSAPRKPRKPLHSDS